jgi:hypothetical protein
VGSRSFTPVSEDPQHPPSTTGERSWTPH